jgi:hypothetical protein
MSAVLVFFAETLWIIALWIGIMLGIAVDSIHRYHNWSAHFHFIRPP